LTREYSILGAADRLGHCVIAGAQHGEGEISRDLKNPWIGGISAEGNLGEGQKKFFWGGKAARTEIGTWI